MLLTFPPGASRLQYRCLHKGFAGADDYSGTSLTLRGNAWSRALPNPAYLEFQSFIRPRRPVENGYMKAPTEDWRRVLERGGLDLRAFKSACARAPSLCVIYASPSRDNMTPLREIAPSEVESHYAGAGQFA